MVPKRPRPERHSQLLAGGGSRLPSWADADDRDGTFSRRQASLVPAACYAILALAQQSLTLPQSSCRVCRYRQDDRTLTIQEVNEDRSA